MINLNYAYWDTSVFTIVLYAQFFFRVIVVSVGQPQFICKLERQEWKLFMQKVFHAAYSIRFYTYQVLIPNLEYVIQHMKWQKLDIP